MTIHDPYNSVKGDHYIKLDKINQGKLIHNADDNEPFLTDNATGFYETRLDYLKADEVGIVDGAIVLGM